MVGRDGGQAFQSKKERKEGDTRELVQEGEKFKRRTKWKST